MQWNVVVFNIDTSRFASAKTFHLHFFERSKNQIYLAGRTASAEKQTI